jgi:hypothetical protein
MRKHAIAAGIAALSIGSKTVAYAEDSTKQALREFGWEGVWSQDCSISNVFREGDKRVLARGAHAIPWVGPPTNTIELFYESGPLAGISSKSIYIVTSARMASDNKIVVTTVSHSDDADTTSESVETMLGGKIFTIRGTLRGVAKKDIPGGIFSVGPLFAGDHFTYDTSENGMSLAPDGSIKAGPILMEKCNP